MERGKLWGDGWMREGVWLEGPKATGFAFQTTKGETIVLGHLQQITHQKGGYTMTERETGLKFELEIE